MMLDRIYNISHESLRSVAKKETLVILLRGFLVMSLLFSLISTSVLQSSRIGLRGSGGKVVVSVATKALRHRKLLSIGDRPGDACSLSDIVIVQGETTPLPDGIPSFTVQVINLCVSGCAISEVHVSCGWFASSKMINPTVFKRVEFDDCIVNDGLPIKGGDSVTFEYSNLFQYPLMVTSANTCCL